MNTSYAKLLTALDLHENTVENFVNAVNDKATPQACHDLSEIAEYQCTRVLNAYRDLKVVIVSQALALLNNINDSNIEMVATAKHIETLRTVIESLDNLF